MEDYSNYEDDGYAGMGSVGVVISLAVAEQNYRAHPNEATYAAFLGAQHLANPTAKSSALFMQAIAGARSAVARGVTFTPAEKAAVEGVYHLTQNPVRPGAMISSIANNIAAGGPQKRTRGMTVAQAAARHVAVARAPRASSWGVVTARAPMTVAQAAARHVARQQGKVTVHVTPPPARGRVYATPPPARGTVYVTPPPRPQARAAAQAAQRESRRQLEIARLQARNAARTAAARRKILQTISGLQVQIARAQAQLATLR